MKFDRQTRRFFLILFLSFGITAVFLLPFCDAMFDCGCTWAWAEAANLCNVRQAGIPHCPWCERRNPVLMASPFLVIFIGQGLALHHVNKRQGSTVLMLSVGLITFLMLGALSGFSFQRLDNYPYFFF